MADEVFEVRTNAKRLVLLRKSPDYDPSDYDAVVTVLQQAAEPAGVSVNDCALHVEK